VIILEKQQINKANLNASASPAFKSVNEPLNENSITNSQILQLKSDLSDLNMPLSPSHILQLQKSLGNKAVVQLVKSRLQQAQTVPLQLSETQAGRNRSEQGFFAIAAAVAEQGDTFFGRDQYSYPSLGFTTKVKDHDGPEIDYKTEEDDEGKWTASPELTGTSEEGTNDSWALAAGTHAVPAELVSGKPLFVRVDADMASSIKDAEDEHNADYKYAKEQILDKADAWLQNGANLSDNEYGPEDSEEKAEALVDADINPALKAHLGLTGVADFEWANIGSYYALASNMTDARDTAGWHDFDHTETEEADSVIREITKGDSEVGSHASSDVVILADVSLS
jgi:hypothetical protein